MNESRPSELPRLLSLTVHELRTPLTTASGYVRMLLKERAGPLAEAQRRLLVEAERSCSRLADLLTEMSELSNLEAGHVELQGDPLDLFQLVAEAVASFDARSDDGVPVSLQGTDGTAGIRGDGPRLLRALTSLIRANRREMAGPDPIVVRRDIERADGRAAATVLIGRAEALAAWTASDQLAFDEWRGGNGLALPFARRIIERHGGTIWGIPAAAGKPGTGIRFPL